MQKFFFMTALVLTSVSSAAIANAQVAGNTHVVTGGAYNEPVYGSDPTQATGISSTPEGAQNGMPTTGSFMGSGSVGATAGVNAMSGQSSGFSSGSEFGGASTSSTISTQSQSQGSENQLTQ